jgi:hypothetical protein
VGVGVGIYTYIIYIPTYIYMYLHIYVCVQTAEHTLLECAILREERERLIAAVAKTDNWPIKKDMFIKKHYKAFAEFTKTMDKLKQLNTL